MDPDELGHVVRTFLSERQTMALATCGPEGLWVAAVYFASDVRADGLRLYFLSSPNSRHGRNLAAGACVAADIHQDEHDWRSIRGVQLEGVGEIMGGRREQLGAWRVYLAKFPFVRELFGGAAGALRAKLKRTQMYCVRVGRLFYLDNRLGFGERRAIPLTALSERTDPDLAPAALEEQA